MKERRLLGESGDRPHFRCRFPLPSCIGAMADSRSRS
jgi:hypothetical protein